MSEIAIARSNGDRGGKKKEGFDEFSWIKTGQKIEKEKRERQWKKLFLDKYNGSREILWDVNLYADC
jgi:hypothetical protein